MELRFRSLDCGLRGLDIWTSESQDRGCLSGWCGQTGRRPEFFGLLDPQVQVGVGTAGAQSGSLRPERMRGQRAVIQRSLRPQLPQVAGGLRRGGLLPTPILRGPKGMGQVGGAGEVPPLATPTVASPTCFSILAPRDHPKGLFSDSLGVVAAPSSSSQLEKQR